MKRNDRIAAFQQRTKKAIHSPMCNHHSLIPWGSFRDRQEEKWGSFRGRDHFGGCTHYFRQRNGLSLTASRLPDPGKS